MTPKDKDYKLIKIYFFICDHFKELQYYCQRFSNNKAPKFTDQEIMTIYLYVMHQRGYTKIKDIHSFACEYLRDWFPSLGSYQAFNNRLNRLGGAFNRLAQILQRSCIPMIASLIKACWILCPSLAALADARVKLPEKLPIKGIAPPKECIIMV